MNAEVKLNTKKQVVVKKKRRGLSLRKKENLYAWLFISPMVLGFLFVMVGPFLFSIYVSFTDWPLLGASKFIGIDNYQRMIHEPVFGKVLMNTITFAAGLVPINIILALLLALLLYKKLPGMGIFRTAIFIPVMTSIVVWSIIWKYLFATDSGFINQLLSFIGVKGPAWLYDPDLTMAVVIIVSALKNVGLNMVLFLAGLLQVPKNLYEAAYIDGAGRFKQFWHVTVPMITPTIFLTVVLTIIGSMKVFGQIYVMTHGGPGNTTTVLVYYIWQQAFKLYDFGYASAVAIVLFLIIMVFTLIQWNLRKRWVFHEQ